eukprot:1105360-Rhodomonas_salina.1
MRLIAEEIRQGKWPYQERSAFCLRACDIRCPVLTWWFGTARACTGKRMNTTVMTLVSSAVRLHARYTLSGTERAYAATMAATETTETASGAAR